MYSSESTYIELQAARATRLQAVFRGHLVYVSSYYIASYAYMCPHTVFRGHQRVRVAKPLQRIDFC